MDLAHADITIHEFTHVGQCEQNQDRLAVLESPDGESRLLVVADGLGGHAGGSLAAELVIATADRCWEEFLVESAEGTTGKRHENPAQETPESTTDATPEAASKTVRDTSQASASGGRAVGQQPSKNHPGHSPEKFLNHLVRECHHAVNHAGREQGLDPYSTIAVLLLRDGQAISTHAGDSRVMQYSETEFVERTLDHSVAQLHALRGIITDDEIAAHPDQPILFAQVGGRDAPMPETNRWDLSKGGRFVLCSDGFWEIFPHDEILELFNSDDPAIELENRYERKLRQLEDHDNTTAILVEVVPGRASIGEAEALPDGALPAGDTPAHTKSGNGALPASIAPANAKSGGGHRP